MKKTKKAVAILALSFLALNVQPVVKQSTQTVYAATLTADTQSTSIPGMPSPNFDTGDPGFKTDKTASSWIKQKSMILLSLAFGLATVALAFVGLFKFLKLSSSNSRDRGEAVKDIGWWIGGAGGTFAVAIILGLVYALSTQ